ncbi:MAG: methylmalonyl-CoA mutase [Candidatus Marinimicrobia bacterium]|nr:methylmalonyl-CoA mutase [Candidatus Neomarinimicrobiota bacterium]
MNKNYVNAENQWKSEKNNSKVRNYNFDTVSGLKVDELYYPEKNNDKYLDKLGFPGQYPFTRGVHANLYRGKLWTMRQFAGFGSPKETNRRFKFLLDQGQTGLSVAYDMPTLMGYDADHPISVGEVGKCGVSISSLKDMETLFEGINLGNISVSQTINGPAIILFAYYIAAAENQGIDISSLRGTLQNDILKEYIAQKEWIYPPKESMRIITDMIQYCAKNIPQYNTISVSGYHIREAGSTAAQELAFTLADGFCYVEHAIEAGLDVDQFAPRLSFFFNSHLDFFEEIAKFRAARRIWANLMKEKYGAKNPRSWKLRFHTQTAGFSLTAQQPENNIARTGFQAMAAVLGGTQSLHTNSMDETLALPSEKAAEIALRTQQLIAYETGVTNVVDPLGGSWFIEKLTDEMEKKVLDYFDKIEDLGGVIPAIELGFFQREIAEASMEYQKKVENNQRIIVGINDFVKENEKIDIPILEINPETEMNQVDKLKRLKLERNNDYVEICLDKVRATAQNGKNLLPPIIEAAKAHATLGEVVDVLKVEFGEWQEKAII